MATTFTVQRNKGGVVHYAQQVAPNGSVSKWTTDKADAHTISELHADKVGEHFSKAEGAGVITLLNEKGKPHAKIETPPKPKAKPGAFIPSVSPDLEKRYRELKVERDEFQVQAETLGEQLQNARDTIEALTKELSELKALLESAK